MLSGVGRLAADGCFVVLSEVRGVTGNASTVTSPKQEAILATDGRRVQVVLRTHFDQGPKELAWIVPVPAEPTNIRTCEGTAVFADLDQLTAPKFFTESISSSHGMGLHIGCNADAQLGANRDGTPLALSVRVVSQGTAGMYEYAVLSSKDAGDLEKWLNQHQYAVPKDAAEVFKKYTDKGWYWLAMRIRADATKEQVLAPHPITYMYQGELVFPLVISTLSSADESEIVLYIVGKTNFDTINWKSVDLGDFTGRAGNHNIPMPPVQLDPKSSSGTTYESDLRKLTKSNGGHLFVRELCEQWQLFGHEGMGRRFDDILDADLIDTIGKAQTITRLRAFVKRSDMDIDVQLEAKEKERQIQNRIYIRQATSQNSTADSGTLLLCLLPLGGAWAALKRRGKPGRRVAKVIVIMMCLILTMM